MRSQVDRVVALEDDWGRVLSLFVFEAAEAVLGGQLGQDVAGSDVWLLVSLPWLLDEFVDRGRGKSYHNA